MHKILDSGPAIYYFVFQETIKKREEQEELMAGDSNSSQDLDIINERGKILQSFFSEVFYRAV